MINRIVIVALCLLGLASPEAREASAQPPSPARADTIGSPGLFRRLSFHPSYNSGYQVNRTSKSWDQKLEMSRTIGPLRLGNNWSIRQRRDEAQSNLRARTGLMDFKADYGLGSRRIWTIGLDGTFRRDSRLSRLNDQVENRSDLALATESRYPEHLMREHIPFLKNASLSTAANFGRGLDESVSRRSGRRDSTRTIALIEHYDASLTGDLRGVGFSASVTEDRRDGDSRTRQRDAQGRLTGETKDATSNRSRYLNGNLSWKPHTTLQSDLTGRWGKEINEYWDILANEGEGGRESKEGQDIGTDLTLAWSPAKDYSLSGNVRKSTARAGYALQSRDFTKVTTSGTIEGSAKLPPIAGPLKQTELRMAFGEDKAENALEDQADFEQVTRRMRVGVMRRLGQKFMLQLSQDISLLRFTYDGGTNDRDERRSVTDAVLNYRPSAIWSGFFSYNTSERISVSIPGEKAGNNNTNQTYKVTGQVTYTRGSMRIDQQYSVQADYTFYDTERSRDALIRTNGVQTTFSNPISSRIAVALSHEYQFRESGRYLQGTGGDPRTYDAQSQERRQVLSLSSNYTIAQAVRLEARQMFDRRENRTLSAIPGRPDRVSTSDRGEFSLRAELEKTFSDAFKVSGSFQKTMSLTEKDFWNVRASVERTF